MPGVIDSLIVLLGLDKSNFDKGQKDAQNSLKKTGDEAEKLRKRHETEAKKTAEAYGAVRDSIMGVAAAVVTMVAGGKMLDYLTRNDAAAGRLAGNIGATAREVSILEGVWRRMGSSSADADSFLRNTNKILEEIKLTGTSSALLPFVQGGLNVAAFRDAKTYQDRAAMLARAAGNLTPQDAQFRLQAAGYSEDTIGILLRNKNAMESLFESQKKLNAINDGDDKLAQERQQAWSEFGQAIEGVGRSIANFFTPVLVGALHALRDFTLWIKENVPGAIIILGSLGSALLLLKGYSISSMAAAFTGNIAAMAGSVGVLLGRLGLLGLAFTGGYAIGTGLNKAFDLDDKISSWFAPDMPFDLQAGTVSGGAPSRVGMAPAGGVNFSALESKYGLPVGLLDQMWRQESGRGTNMLSKAGAKGHFQFMDATAAQYGLKNPNDLNESADAAARYMHDLMGANGGNLARALAAYNEGQGNLNAGRMPLETMGYVTSIMGGMQASRARSAANVSVGNVTIQTTSSTMTGTGADLGKGLSNYLVAQQANNGVN